MNRFFLGRFFRLISKSWQMYPLGVLFGLGFDTATEVGLLALAAGVASHAVPFLAVLSLPLLFAAGMSLMDTADGAFMSQAYGWAFSNPIRKVYYNITVTSLSVTVALAVGSVELLQVLATQARARLGFWGWLNALDFAKLGYAIVGALRPHLGRLGADLEGPPDRRALGQGARRLGPPGGLQAGGMPCAKRKSPSGSTCVLTCRSRA